MFYISGEIYICSISAFMKWNKLQPDVNVYIVQMPANGNILLFTELLRATEKKYITVKFGV